VGKLYKIGAGVMTVVIKLKYFLGTIRVPIYGDDSERQWRVLLDIIKDRDEIAWICIEHQKTDIEFEIIKELI
jgi:nitrogen fixation-related uncharacterized protein